MSNSSDTPQSPRIVQSNSGTFPRVETTDQDKSASISASTVDTLSEQTTSPRTIRTSSTISAATFSTSPAQAPQAAQAEQAAQTAEPEHSYSSRKARRYRIQARRQARARSRMHNILDTFFWVVVPVVVVLLLRYFVIGLYVIPSASMENTLPVGAHVVTNRLGISANSIKRGDIVVFTDDSGWLTTSQVSRSQKSLLGFLESEQFVIKRVIGLPGDRVTCEGSGQPVKVNGVAVDETSYIGSVKPSETAFDITVTPGNLFVMGDNRPNSGDSRYHLDDGNGGLVRIESVVGIAMAVYWPMSDWKLLGSGRDVFARAGLG